MEAPAITLGGNGAEAATATFSFDLLQTDLLGGNVDAALTALMETTARLPLEGADVERARQFVVADLLTEPPEQLEACYLMERPTGVLLITVDTETGVAELDVARELHAIDTFANSKRRRACRSDLDRGAAPRRAQLGAHHHRHDRW